jgi:ISXO2-like transposase domain
MTALTNFQREVVDNAVEYVRGEVHANRLENFWSLLKRGINGTYVSVEPFHLFRYLDEQAFRYNNRVGFTDKSRFDLAVRQKRFVERERAVAQGSVIG